LRKREDFLILTPPQQSAKIRIHSPFLILLRELCGSVVKEKE
jgi:hypothetical protein